MTDELPVPSAVTGTETVAPVWVIDPAETVPRDGGELPPGEYVSDGTEASRRSERFFAPVRPYWSFATSVIRRRWSSASDVSAVSNTTSKAPPPFE